MHDVLPEGVADSGLAAVKAAIATNEVQKCSFPAQELIMRPVTFGYQKYNPAKRAKIVPGATT